MVALGATSLAEVAHIACCAFVNGVGDKRGSPTESRPKELFLQVWQGCVAQTEGALAARIGTKASSSATSWRRAEHAALWGGEGTEPSHASLRTGFVVVDVVMLHGCVERMRWSAGRRWTTRAERLPAEPGSCPC